MMDEKEIDTSQSQGAIVNPQADVSVEQQYGNRSNTDTGGGDAAGGNVDKRNISQTFNIFLGSDSSSATQPQSSIQQLVQILGEIGNTDSVRLAYRDSLPTDSYLSRPEALGHADMVAQLQEFRRLMEFVEQLAGDRHMPQPVQQQLQDLIQQWKGKEESQSQARPAPIEKLQSYLQVVVSPGFGFREFTINGWLVLDNGVQEFGKHFHPLDLEDGQKGTVCTLEQIPEKLDQFLNESLQLLRGKRYDLTIEVFLPLDYLCTEIDRWKLNDPDLGFEYLVGTEYRIVVRSSERLSLKYLDRRWNAWCTNWERLQQGWHKPPDVSDFEHLSQLETCNWKQFALRLTDKVGLKLTCGLIESQRKELFTHILMAAAPIAIWVRCDLPHLDSLAEIDELLGMGPLMELAEKVWKKRKDADAAENSEAHLGSHIALLWEDPHRLTPDAMAQLIPTGE
jgi:hypothetical protein